MDQELLCGVKAVIGLQQCSRGRTFAYIKGLAVNGAYLK